MNVEQVVNQLKHNYPNRKIIRVPEGNPTEIICETSPGNGIAIAVIDRSALHRHERIKESYIVLQGDLRVIVNGEETLLRKNDTFEILPGKIHYAIGNETWVKVTSSPPWSISDHILDGKGEA